jgi:hypothetical protein
MGKEKRKDNPDDRRQGDESIENETDGRRAPIGPNDPNRENREHARDDKRAKRV